MIRGLSRFSSIAVVLPAVITLLVTALLADVAVRAGVARKRQQESEQASINVAALKELFSAETGIRLERGAENFALIAGGAAPVPTQRAIAVLRSTSRKALETALALLAPNEILAAGPEFGMIRRRLAALDSLAGEIDAALLHSRDRRPQNLRANLVASTEDLTGVIDTVIFRMASGPTTDDPLIIHLLRVAHNVWLLRATAGNDRFFFTTAVRSSKPLSDDAQRAFGAVAEQIKGRWALVKEDIGPLVAAPQFAKSIDAVEREYFIELPPKREIVMNDLAAGRSVSNSLSEWRTLAASAHDKMVTVMNIALDMASAKARVASAQAADDLMVALIAMGVVFTIGTLNILYVFRKIVQPMKKISGAMLSVADGELAFAVPFASRSDEIGLLARALCVFRDRAVEHQQMLGAKVAAEAANKTKSDFLAIMSHELRTPLNAIIGFSDVMRRAMFGPLSEQYRGYGGDIFDSGNHLLNLINDILDLSKLEAGKFELYEEQIDLAAAIKMAMHLIEPQAKKANVALVTTVPASLPWMRADERRIRQIMLNLISNAVKFTRSGGSVNVSASLDANSLIIVVRDTGIGMSADEIPRALEPFGQIDSQLSRKSHGTGLGLPLARHFTELHGGGMTVESTLNVGTTITVAFPSGRTVTPPMPAQATA